MEDQNMDTPAVEETPAVDGMPAAEGDMTEKKEDEDVMEG